VLGRTFVMIYTLAPANQPTMTAIVLGQKNSYTF